MLDFTGFAALPRFVHESFIVIYYIYLDKVKPKDIVFIIKQKERYTLNIFNKFMVDKKIND